VKTFVQIVAGTIASMCIAFMAGAWAHLLWRCLIIGWELIP
jgi:hypothetical protein